MVAVYKTIHLQAMLMILAYGFDTMSSAQATWVRPIMAVGTFLLILSVLGAVIFSVINYYITPRSYMEVDYDLQESVAWH